MRKISFVAFFVFLAIFFLGADLSDQRAKSILAPEFDEGSLSPNNIFYFRSPATENDLTPLKSSQLAAIQVFGARSGIAYTSDALFRTDDNGETWREITPAKNSSEKIAAVVFESETDAVALLGSNRAAQIAFAETRDGGRNWTKTALALNERDALEADFENAALEILASGEMLIALRLPTSSNFTGRIFYESANARKIWNFKERAVENRQSDQASAETIDEHWVLKTAGSCAGVKTGCVRETKIYIGAEEITPPQILELARLEKERARLAAGNSIFAQPPGGATRISLNRGFDKCTAATAAQMQTWWTSSPFYDANIYISGRNRACAQPQLTAAWVDQVSSQGWGLIPTIVGYQAPCSVSTNSAKHSSDPTVAEQQGRGEADIAVTDATNLGLTTGSVLYYDMERYDETVATPGCRTAVKAFLKGWTDRVKELGYLSGVYGSPTNAVGDWISIPEASRMDAVWLARWDNIPSVWTYASPSPVVPENVWANHQRIKQWQAPHNETWGNVTFNIDGNIADGPVAGIQPAKNKTADFDGDGKTDISVWRPETGVWYIINSSNASFSIINFGLASDVLAPGDYDGDGKTDLAIFRPADGVWHFLSRSIYRAYQFGAPGDIPVPADYDGDGRADAAIFRPSTGTWYIVNSFDSRGTSIRIEQFGLGGDKPVAGDYDGDGRADLAVFRPSDGIWYLLRSTQGFAAINFGLAGDRAVQADYDGDGKTDLGIYRDGVWYLNQSTDGILVTQFGLAGDVPSVGDYDGDARADLAVFRPETGTWYISGSQGGIVITQFGSAADKTVPSAYVPQN